MQRRVLLVFTSLFLFVSLVCSGAQLNRPPSKEHQGITGGIAGTVHNQHNEPLKDVRIEIVPTMGVMGATATTYTDPAGGFEFSNLSYGKYVLTATLGVAGTS